MFILNAAVGAVWFRDYKGSGVGPGMYTLCHVYLTAMRFAIACYFPCNVDLPEEIQIAVMEDTEEQCTNYRIFEKIALV